MTLISDQVWENIAATPLATAVRESIWLYPFLETLHIVGLVFVVGSIWAFDLRILGRNKGMSVITLGHHLLPWVWTGFAMNATTGALLFISDAAEFAGNTALQVKLLLIATAGVNAAIFQGRLYRSVESWDRNIPAPAAARTSAALSILLWLLIIVAGRMIAYVE